MRKPVLFGAAAIAAITLLSAKFSQLLSKPNEGKNSSNMEIDPLYLRFPVVANTPETLLETAQRKNVRDFFNLLHQDKDTATAFQVLITTDAFLQMNDDEKHRAIIFFVEHANKPDFSKFRDGQVYTLAEIMLEELDHSNEVKNGNFGPQELENAVNELEKIGSERKMQQFLRNVAN